jgi:uncharacterized protein (TIGR03032 family)
MVAIMALTESDVGLKSVEGGPSPVSAVHTTNFPALLRELGASLLLTTYQSGKVALVREDGEHLNTHFRAFPTPMGLALDGDRLAIGTTSQVWEYVDVPAIAAKLDPPGRHDACFVPRASHVTGNIHIHEMAWSGSGELWVVNALFSCLCTLDRSASFTPRWRPPFVPAVDPTNRCHLNGLAMVDGRPRYVTALGETDAPTGWRANKATGGIVMDVQSGEVTTRGLSMPHSPRWHNGRLWVCESGAGSVGYIDDHTLEYEPVVFLPGFTRGLDFAGDYAFVGLSQVRESAHFSGIPITERLSPAERTCGVCAIDLRSGQAVGLLQFETRVQEIFAVTVLPGRRYPELLYGHDGWTVNSFAVPDAALADVPAALRSPNRPRARRRRSGTQAAGRAMDL